jgi:GNAT superfamily N-acetyltransferase
VIRPFTRDDVEAVAALHVRAWQRAYADFVALPDMPTLEERIATWGGDLGGPTWVWDQDGLGAVGVVQIRPAELAVLYVDPPAQGAGIGTALHDHALSELRAQGTVRASVWVFTANGHGRDFYAARGWTPTGRTDTWRGIPDIELARDL